VTTPLAPLLEKWRPDALPAAPGRLVAAPGLRALFLASLAESKGVPILAVVPGERLSEELEDDLALFTDAAVRLPAWETLPFEHVSPSIATMAQRSRARHLLRSGTPGVYLASVRAVTQRVSPSPVAPVLVRSGAEKSFDALVADLATLGYHRTDRVEARGEFAVRGGIVDVFPAQGGSPRRIDFWGDEIEEIRRFSVATQRSIDVVPEVLAFPAREFRPDGDVAATASRLRDTDAWAASTWDRVAEGVVFQGMESWLPWLAPERTVLDEMPADTIVVVLDPVQAEARSRELVAEETELAAALAGTWGSGAPAAGTHPALYLGLASQLDSRSVIEAPPVAAGPGDTGPEVRGLDATAGNAESVAAALNGLGARGITTVVAMDGAAAADRTARLLAAEGAVLPRLDALDSPGPAVIATGIHAGFIAPGLGIAVLGEREIAGRRRAHRRPGPARGAPAGAGYRDLEAGDYVVHHQHGIGRFEGLVSRTMAGIEREYLLIAYAGGDKLYVPTDQLAAVRKYTGGEAPRLSRMGGGDWSQVRSKVRQAVAVVAEEVVSLHRRRAAATGHAYPPDTPWQREIEDSFPFEETPDQATAIVDVKDDMEADRPMDRLVFGDVGFGKTEVALRAAFKAIQGGKQAAILVPTTLLAQQHFATFSDRLDPYPIRVEMLSRFLTAAQQRQVVAGLADGTVDLVIGTHRLLSEDIHFSDLGLLVIDEEQRFGVGAKDRLKVLRESVDVLTLTATPIPRTLEMALTGIREVSHIRTPPEDRHPILTYVGPYDQQAVSAAIRREMLREGQVFYVHNRIQSIHRVVAKLQELVPDARFAVAHGRMSEGQLEQVMLDFWNREYDVLVATTIIESGLDLPQVNTLVVERADLLGLAQLYQLRGRVGRSRQRAYAYLFHPPEERLTDEAFRRLEAIGEYSDLGSGFELAMRDLEIRGAGSILGTVQSGHISAVGFDLYVDLVAEAVDELQGVAPRATGPSEVRIDIPVDAHLPDDYVDTQMGRLEAYRRLAAAATQDDVDAVVAEWVDRYGPLPPEAGALIDVARLRAEAIRIGITEIVRVRHEIRMGPVELPASQEVRLQRIAPRAVVRGPLLFIPAPENEPAAALLAFLRTMWPPASDQESP
jgi:transcription-repair coupling factor (superfamily II helicase)